MVKCRGNQTNPLVILVFTIGIISASIAGWNEMDRAPLYLIFWIVFITESIFELYKNFTHKVQVKGIQQTGAIAVQGNRALLPLNRAVNR
jgi:hypothetical protein